MKNSFGRSVARACLFTFFGASAVSTVRATDLRGEYDALQANIIDAHREGKTFASASLTKSAALHAEGVMVNGAVHRNVHALIWDSDRDPLGVVLRRTRALAESIRRIPGAPDLSRQLRQLEQLEAASTQTAGLSKQTEASLETLFTEALALRRAISFTNPLLDFEEILVMTAGMGMGGQTETGGSWGANGPRCNYFQYISGAVTELFGEGPIVLSNWKTGSPSIRKILQTGHPVKRFHSNYDLHPDGTRLAFAGQADLTKTHYSGCQTAEGQTVIFTVNIDGTNLRMITPENQFSKFQPCWLPNGRIAFVSQCASWNGQCYVRGDRCGGYGTALWSMKEDGSDAYPISWHETSEYHPVVDNDGKLVYTRWDYVDRNWDAAHHIWTCGIDGTDPRAPHGNWPTPHCVLEAGTYADGRCRRPWTEMFIRPIPNASQKYVAIAGSHHRPIPGTPVLINTAIPDDDRMSQVQLLAGECLPHEGGCPGCNLIEQYDTPWPLSEDHYLITNRHNLFLLDKFGNRETIYTWTGDGRIFSPRPFRATQMPPRQAERTWQGERSGRSDHYRATVGVINVYQSDFDWPQGLSVKRLRIIQMVAATFGGMPTGSEYGTSAARIVLGTVPVEDDGSAYFEAPVGKAIYFQALDEKGMAIQSMRSITYVHPGEQMTCVGCHENKWEAIAPPSTQPRAFTRAPSPITVEREEARPLSFYRLVQPVFQNKCLPCHNSQASGIRDFSYGALRDWVWFMNGRDATYVPPTGGHKSCAGRFGARESRMGKALLATHGTRITSEELHRVSLWLDANSMQYGAYERTLDQQAGQVVWPILEVDPANPTGVESNRPLPGTVTISRSQLHFGVRDGKLLVSGAAGSNARLDFFDLRGRRFLSMNLDQGTNIVPLDAILRTHAASVFVVRLVTGNTVKSATVSAAGMRL